MCISRSLVFTWVFVPEKKKTQIADRCAQVQGIPTCVHDPGILQGCRGRESSARLWPRETNAGGDCPAKTKASAGHLHRRGPSALLPSQSPTPPLATGTTSLGLRAPARGRDVSTRRPPHLLADAGRAHARQPPAAWVSRRCNLLRRRRRRRRPQEPADPGLVAESDVVNRIQTQEKGGRPPAATGAAAAAASGAAAAFRELQAVLLAESGSRLPPSPPRRLLSGRVSVFSPTASPGVCRGGWGAPLALFLGDCDGCGRTGAAPGEKILPAPHERACPGPRAKTESP